MKSAPYLSFTAAALLLVPALSPLDLLAQSPGALSADQIEKIEARLESLQELIADATLEKNTSLIDIFLTAAGSDSAALKLYLDCVQEVDYERLNQRGQDFREWERRNADRHREEGFVQGLRIQLKYLAISIEAARTDDLATVFPKLREYIDGLTSLDEIPGRALNGSIANSVFARRYELERELNKRAEVWEMDPLNIGGMYDKTILPHLRQESTAQLMAAWDSRMMQEAKLAEVNGEAAEARFRREKVPELKWARLKDMFVYGERVQAAADMLAHIEANVGPPLHPKAGQWLSEFAELMEMKIEGVPAPTREPLPSAPPSAPAPVPVPAPGEPTIETPGDTTGF